jgi:hypothetical protein
MADKITKPCFADALKGYKKNYCSCIFSGYQKWEACKYGKLSPHYQQWLKENGGAK